MQVIVTPNEVAEIFAAGNAAPETATSKPICAGIDMFDETVSAFLVELVREHDEDEHGMLHLSQDT